MGLLIFKLSDCFILSDDFFIKVSESIEESTKIIDVSLFILSELSEIISVLVFSDLSIIRVELLVIIVYKLSE